MADLPMTLYVRMEEDGDSTFPISFVDSEDLDDGDIVGVYTRTAIKLARKKVQLIIGE